MSSPFIGEIRMFAFTFPPYEWADCNGQLVSIAQNEALFAILGTIYGGDGRSTFGLPNLQGSVPVHVGGTSGQGPGLSTYRLGEAGGTEDVTLTSLTIPQHSHTLTLSTPASAGVASATVTASPEASPLITFVQDTAPNTPMASTSLATAGSSLPHENRQPYLAVRFCICLYGVYPSPN